MKHNPPDDLLRAYLSGQLPPAEREQMEKTLLDDPELSEQVALLRAEAAAAELLIAAETRQLFQQWQAEKPQQPSVFRSGPLRWAVGTAVGLLLVFAAWQMFRPATGSEAAAPIHRLTPPPADQPAVPPAPTAGIEAVTPTGSEAVTSSHRLTKKHYLALAKQHLPDPLSANLRRSSTADSAASIFQKAQLAYATGDYPKTLDLLAQTDAAQQQSADFLAAHALFQLGRFGAAAEQFDRLIAQNSRQFRFRSEWGLLMCRLADRPRSETAFQNQLKEILAQPDHPCFQQAVSLREGLK